MKRLALIPLLLIALNVTAMQEEENSQQNSNTSKKNDTFNTYYNIGAKITAGAAFAGLAYFIYQLSSHPEIEAAKKELTKYQPVSVGWMDSFDERFKKALISGHKSMVSRGLVSMLELLTAYSIASSGIISGIAFKSAHDDLQTLHPKSAKIIAKSFKTAAFAAGTFFFANAGTSHALSYYGRYLCFLSAFALGITTWDAANETIDSIKDWSNPTLTNTDYQELNSNNIQEELL